MKKNLALGLIAFSIMGVSLSCMAADDTTIIDSDSLSVTLTVPSEQDVKFLESDGITEVSSKTLSGTAGTRSASYTFKVQEKANYSHTFNVSFDQDDNLPSTITVTPDFSNIPVGPINANYANPNTSDGTITINWEDATVATTYPIGTITATIS